MGAGDDDATFHDGEGESLSNRPSSSHARQGTDAMAGGTLPPQGVDRDIDDSSSNLSESPIKRRPAAKPSSWRSHFKKLRQSAGQAQTQPLRSIPENTQQPVTMEDLANMSAPVQGSPVNRDPATPSSHPADEQEQQAVTAEIDLSTWQRKGYITTKSQPKLPPPQPEKALRCHPYHSTVTCPENGQWQGCVSHASKSTVMFAQPSGEEQQRER